MKKVTESFKKKTLFFERFLFKDVFLESVYPKCHFVISYNGFILKQLQANNQLNHNNQQENINSWKAQAIFPPQCSQFSEESILNSHLQFQVPEGAISQPRPLILLRVTR